MICHLAALVIAGVVLAAAGCGSDAAPREDPVVAVVAGTAIHRSQLDRGVEHARDAAARAQKTFPDDDSSEFRRVRRAILEQLVLNVEVLQAAHRLHVAVPTAAVYEFAAEQAEEEGSGSSDAFARSTVRARLLYEAVARKVTASAKVRPSEVERYYRAHRAELERVAFSPARARLYAETILLRAQQKAIMRRWVIALQRRYRSRVRYP